MLYTGLFKAVEGKEADLFAVPVAVNYGARIEDILQAKPCTRLPAEVNSKNFPAEPEKGIKQIMVKVISFTGRPVFGDAWTDDLLAIIEGHGFEPVDFRELVTALNLYKPIKILPRVYALKTAVDIGSDLKSPWVQDSVKTRRVGFINV